MIIKYKLLIRFLIRLERNLQHFFNLSQFVPFPILYIVMFLSEYISKKVNSFLELQYLFAGTNCQLVQPISFLVIFFSILLTNTKLAKV